MGRTVGAFKRLAGPRSPWVGLGWLGVAVGFILLSFYAVVAGWILRYAYLAMTGRLAGLSVEEIQGLFAQVYADGLFGVLGSLCFIGLTMAVVMAGVRRGLERWSRILMPVLLVMVVVLAMRARTLEGFDEAVGFLFSFDASRLSGGGILEALGHAFFTLSVGVGGMLTYGSYLPEQSNLVADAIIVTVLDTCVALLACLALFPLVFTYGMPPTEGPGLVFVSLPIAFSRMPGGGIVAAVFFALLLIAALTSAISMLELAVSYFIDERGWSRRRATWRVGLAIGGLSIPSALAGSSRVFGAGFEAVLGKNWFDLVADTVTNWLTPLGGLCFALFVGWRLSDAVRRAEFGGRGYLARAYGVWLMILQYVAPLAIVLVFLRSVGLL